MVFVLLSYILWVRIFLKFICIYKVCFFKKNLLFYREFLENFYIKIFFPDWSNYEEIFWFSNSIINEEVADKYEQTKWIDLFCWWEFDWDFFEDEEFGTPDEDEWEKECPSDSQLRATLLSEGTKLMKNNIGWLNF